MKRISFLIIAILLIGGVAMAQGHRKGGNRKVDPKERAERMTERMVKEYSLNEAQKKELLAANVALVEKDREKMRQEMKASRDAYDAQLKKILTKDQYADYTKKQAERRQKMEEHRQSKEK